MARADRLAGWLQAMRGVPNDPGDSPSAASSTILALLASPALPARDDASPASFSRSPSRSTRASATRVPSILPERKKFFYHVTRTRSDQVMDRASGAGYA